MQFCFTNSANDNLSVQYQVEMLRVHFSALPHPNGKRFRGELKTGPGCYCSSSLLSLTVATEKPPVLHGATCGEAFTAAELLEAFQPARRVGKVVYQETALVDVCGTISSASTLSWFTVAAEKML